MSGTSQPGAVPHRALITVCAMVATLMQALDGTIANVALPYMQGGLAATSDQITWVLTSYITAAAILTAPVGFLVGRFGRRSVFLLSVGGFTAASVLCGAAQSLEQMVVFRLLQGAFGAALVPLSQSTMLDIYPPEQRGQAMAIWGMGVMVGPILGPTLGGYLTENLNWRWVFYVNLPFGVLAFIGLLLFLPKGGAERGRRFDWTGFGVLALGVGALQIMLDRGELLNWFGSTEILVEATLAALGLYLFLVHMALFPKPFIPPRIFRDRNFVAGLGIMFVVGVILFATSALLAPYLQTLADYPVFTAGLAMAPRGIGTMAAMFVAGRLAAKLDPRKIMAFGILILAWTLWDMTYWTPDVAMHWLMGVTVIQGMGLGFVFIPLNLVAFATLDPALRTDGTSLISLLRNLGSAIGISALAALLTRNTQIMHANLAEHVTPLNRMFDLPNIHRFWDPSTAQGAAALNAEVTRQSSIIAYGNDFHLLMLLALGMLLLLPLMRRPPRAVAADPAHAAMD
ncbi:DHA2 family efflux MFS transporter permease subunit [Paracraurococcus ruber]|uniref:EmrB/QacA family drug resistance transporter n=1 Tax=Paracraurococcus ruber TaxID=77675 RepID=A0ABS1CTZ3_9PROT|nr:DHA2 family efflux MFS transporter permease subunit [Paracraurococcus ruber]MBK1657813.1 EmrB/QacA family drug resistance transporter [Paracraurococcus ruber]TDG31409.1 DHA2 family efflux MFS transporter permease subunit [Paracraurococcus ruber]